MNNAATPPLAHGHPVLGVAELLESVLLNLSPGDTLYNAQAVCRFWKECIQGSIAIKKKCFLVADIISEGATGHRLFLRADLPDLGKYLVPKWRQLGDTQELGLLTKVNLDIFRAAIASDPATMRFQYKVAIGDYFLQLKIRTSEELFEKEVMRLRVSMGREDDNTDDERVYESLFDMSRLNPLLRRSWKAKGSAVFTGYGKHMIFALGDNWAEACEYFSHIRAFLETIVHGLNTSHSRRTWNAVQVSSPTVAKLAITIHLPEDADVTRTVWQDTGITMRVFATTFITLVREILLEYHRDDFKRWMARIRGYKRGGVIWTGLMRLYKQEMGLIKDLLRQLKVLGVV